MRASSGRIVALVTTLLAACVGGAPASVSSTPSQPATRTELEHTLVGCYSVRLGLFHARDALDASFRRAHAGTEHSTPPRIVALDSGGVLGPAPRIWPTIHRLNYWQLDSLSDSLQMVFSTGYSGVRLTLAAAGDSLIGHADDFWDFTHLSERAPVLLRRVACDSA